MFMFDVETLGKETNSVILSMAILYFNPEEELDHNQLRENTLFIKLDAGDQVERLGRGVTKSTLEWWEKQCPVVRDKSLKRKSTDVRVEDGIELMREYANKHDPKNKDIVWARGGLDQLVLDAMETKLGVASVFFYNRWRDVRTAVDLMTGSTTGYCKVDHAGFNPDLHITKHDPVDDCVYDVMMLLYGRPNETED